MFRLRDAQQDALRKESVARGIRGLLEQNGAVTQYDPATSVILSRDAVKRPTRYQLDEFGFIGEVTTPAGRKTRFLNDRDGKLQAFREPTGHTTSFAFGPDAELSSWAYDGVKLCDISSNAAESRTVVRFWDGSQSELTLNAAGKVVACTNRVGATDRFTYDALGRLVEVTDGSANSVRMRYGDDGRPSSTSYADGRRESVERDINGKRVSAAVNGKPIYAASYAGTSPEPATVVYADGERFEFKRDEGGRLLEASGPECKSTFVYDGKRLTQETNDGHAFHFEYDATGLLTSIQYPDGSHIRYAYDPDKRVAAVTGWDGLVTSAHYDSGEQYTAWRTPNGLVSHAALHVNGKPTRKVLFHEANRNVVTDTQFEYDIERRLIAKTNAARGRHEYQYDAESRLLAVRGAVAGTQVFSYDAAGSRAASTLGGALIERGNRLVQQAADRFAYDERGNVVSALLGGEPWHYTYDLRNQMREARGPRGVVSFAYDALGRRISKSTVERHVQYIWCGEQLAREIITGSAGTSVRDYAYLPGSHVPIALRVDGKSYYFHGDQQGTPELLTDSTGQVVWSASYEAFGAAQVDVAQVDNPLRHAGQYFDEETGLHYNRFRYYSPRIGRYLSPDPLGLLGGHNLYAYVGNDPINRVDPLGLFWGGVAWALAGAAVAVAVVALAPIAVSLVAAAAVGAVVGFGLHEALTMDHFCVPCFFAGMGKAVVVGLATVAAIALLPEELAIAATVGVIALGALGIRALTNRWGKMNDDEKSDALGGIVGGLLVAAGAGPLAPPGEGIPMETGDGRLIMVGAGWGSAVAPAGGVLGTDGAYAMQGDSYPDDPPGTTRDANGKLHNEDGTFAKDPNAGGDDPITHRATKEDMGNGGAELDPNDPDTAAALKQRNDANAERDAALARGDQDAANAAQTKANKATEKLGTQAMDQGVQANYPDAADDPYKGEGPGTFDGVYKNNGTPPPEYIVGEAKGGSGSNSSSRAGPDGERYQQGTPEYRDSVIQQMRQSSDPETKAMGDKLATTDPANIDYVEVKQPVDNDGTLKPIKMSKYGPSEPVDSSGGEDDQGGDL